MSGSSRLPRSPRLRGSRAEHDKPGGSSFGPVRRLSRHIEFVYAQRSGRRVTTAHFVLLVSARPAPEQAAPTPLAPARLGIVTSRKIGGAVQRNRVRRLCRECFRRWPDLLPAGVDLVVIARPGAPDLGLASVESEWRAVESQLKKRAREALARGGGKPHVGGGPSC